MKHSSLAVIMLLFLTSMAGDTSQPGKARKSLWDKIFRLRQQGDKIRADTKVNIALTQLRVDSNYVKIDSLLKKDSLNKN